MDPYDSLLRDFQSIAEYYQHHRISPSLVQYHIRETTEQNAKRMAPHARDGLDLLSAALSITIPLNGIRQRSSAGLSRPEDRVQERFHIVAIEHARTILEPYRFEPFDYSDRIDLETMVNAHDVMIQHGLDQCSFTCLCGSPECGDKHGGFALTLRDLECSIISATKAALLLCHKRPKKIVP